MLYEVITGTLLMALANKFNSLLLSTGNKSEMAVGYCTLYGDMAGALSLLSDVPKQMVYALARYVNCQQEIIPARTISRAPSAELAPRITSYNVCYTKLLRTVRTSRRPGPPVR